MRLFVGKLPWSYRDDDLRRLFGEFGCLVDAHVVMYRDQPTRSKGFGFVEFESADLAREVIKQMDGTELNGRQITVAQAHERATRDRTRQEEAQ